MTQQVPDILTKKPGTSDIWPNSRRHFLKLHQLSMWALLFYFWRNILLFPHTVTFLQTDLHLHVQFKQTGINNSLYLLYHQVCVLSSTSFPSCVCLTSIPCFLPLFINLSICLVESRPLDFPCLVFLNKRLIVVGHVRPFGFVSPVISQCG